MFFHTFNSIQLLIFNRVSFGSFLQPFSKRTTFMKTLKKIGLCLLTITLVCTMGLHGAGLAKLASQEDKAAERLLERGDLRLKAGQKKEAIAIYKSVVDRYPNSKYKYKSLIKLGNAYMLEKDYIKAISFFSNIITEGKKNPKIEELPMAQFLIGKAFFEDKNMSRAFVEFRKVIDKYSGTKLCNDAYHYIGLGHFQLGHYKKAIEAFKMVGTIVEETPEDVKRIEINRMLFVKIKDTDLKIFPNDNAFDVMVTTEISKDRERIRMTPLGISGTVYVGNIATELAEAEPKNGILEVNGLDKAVVTYTDMIAGDKQLNKKIVERVQFVSDGKIGIVDGAFGENLGAVVANKNMNLKVIDFDRSVSPKKDKVNVVVRVKRKIEEETDEVLNAILDASKSEDDKEEKKDEEDQVTNPNENEAEGLKKEKVKYKVIDEHTFSLQEWLDPKKKEEMERRAREDAKLKKAKLETDESKEIENGEKQAVKEPVPAKKKASADKDAKPNTNKSKKKPKGFYAGTFTGRVLVERLEIGEKPDPNDAKIQAALGDVIEVEYVDENTMKGIARVHKTEVSVVEGVLERVRIPEAKVQDSSLKVKKHLRGSGATTSIGNIFKDLGLKLMAQKWYNDSLGEINEVMTIKDKFSKKLLEETYVQLWKVYYSKGDYRGAVEVCRKLQANFPNSVFADDALMLMAKVAEEEKSFSKAISIYNNILRLSESPFKPEAQYHIALCYEKMAKGNKGASRWYEKALSEYQKTFDEYPLTNYAAEAIVKIAAYYYHKKKYSRAIEIYNDLLAKYPDAEYVDVVLYNYGKCMYKMGNFRGAAQKFAEIISDYPDSKYVESAKKAEKICMQKAEGS